MKAHRPDSADEAADLAAAVTRRSASNLWFVGQALPVRKQRLFEAAYATMRVIDDFVDDEFLNLPANRREAARPDGLARVDRWLAGAEAALANIEGAANTDIEGRLFSALRRASKGSDLSAEPWQALAAAMRFDVREGRLNTWEDFERYCEGATVAPAAVFLFVLQAREARDGALSAALPPERLAAQARDMAVFCYLVHILRDFGKDAARGGQLLTVPAEAFARTGVTRAAVEENPKSALPLLRDLAVRAAARRDKARTMADRLIPELSPREGAILGGLLSIYERLHDALLQDPTPGSLGAGVTTRIRAKLAETLGLPA